MFFCLSIHEVSDISSVLHNDMFNIYLTVSLRTRGNVRRVGGKNLGGGVNHGSGAAARIFYPPKIRLGGVKS